MLDFTATPPYQELLTSSFNLGRSCQDELIGSDTDQITLDQMQGFFVIFGILVGIAVAAASMRAVQTAYSGQIKKNEDNEAEGLTDAEMIVKVLQKVDEISRAISVSSKSAVPAADERDIELNLGQEAESANGPNGQCATGQEAPAQLIQKVQMLEAEKEVEAMRIRALE